MGKFFSDKVEEGIRKVWMTYDKEEMEQGFVLFQEAAEEGDADGYCFLARCYMGSMYVWKGGDLPVDDSLAAQYVKESVLRGSAVGILCAMRCGELTPGIRKNMPLSLKDAFNKVLEKAEAGHPFCQYMIGNAYYWGDMLEIEGEDEMMKRFPTENDYDAYAYPIAAGWYQKAFQGGYSFGFGNFRKIYQEGKGGITPDPVLVEKWQKYVADAGDVVQQCNYGAELEEKGDMAGALHYYELAASKGNVVALYNAGCCYLFGNGTKVDKQKAYMYFEEAATKGDCDAQFRMGDAYFEGVEMSEDNARAVYWLEKSAEQNCFWAYPQLGMCYQNGWGVETDYSRAFQLFQEAEKHMDQYGNVFQTYICQGLGSAYGWGEGVDEDIELGISYLDKGIQLGCKYCAKMRGCFKKGMFGLGKWKRVD